jgi:Pyruvate/2-oxoacid:ferredoxin oxidoreductase delta subunit
VAIATRGGLKIGGLYTPGFEGSATLLVALILAAKGYRIRGTAGIDMPSNWTALHPSLPPQAVASIIERAHARTARFSDRLLSGRQHLLSWLTWLLGVLLLPISLGYLLVGRFFLAKLFFASSACTSCGLCAEHCPNQAIEMRGDGDEARPYWTSRCESCMRCMATCPVEAVEASQGLAIGITVLSRVVPTAAAVAWLTARLPLVGFLGRVPPWIVVWTTALAALAAAYPLIYGLLRVRPLNKLFTYATLTRLYRRYHEPATTLKDLNRREQWTSKA